jgi:hypothetical protein
MLLLGSIPGENGENFSCKREKIRVLAPLTYRKSSNFSILYLRQIASQVGKPKYDEEKLL